MHPVSPMFVHYVEEPAPPVLFRTYKDTRVADEAHGRRGTCCALVCTDEADAAKLTKCGAPVVARGKRKQACDSHLRCPTICQGDALQGGAPAFERFCVQCDHTKDLDCFRGFHPYCELHAKGTSLRAKPVLVPMSVPGEGALLNERPRCKTIICQRTPHSVRRAKVMCDTGCGRVAQVGVGLCSICRQVRSLAPWSLVWRHVWKRNILACVHAKRVIKQ